MKDSFGEFSGDFLGGDADFFGRKNIVNTDKLSGNADFSRRRKRWKNRYAE